MQPPVLPSTMQTTPLTLLMPFRRNGEMHTHKKVYSVMDDGKMHVYTYRDFQQRVRRLANVLIDLGVKEGDRVATFAYNHYQHLELYFAIPLVGAVLHTLNIRLFAEQISYIVSHAEDKIIFVDHELQSTLGQLHVAVRYYEDLIRVASPTFLFREDLHENAGAILCYTSGTTGAPKGVLYAHRSMVLASLVMLGADAFAISERDRLLLAVPMFHANAWNYPFASVWSGAELIFAGKDVSGAHLTSLALAHKPTFGAGVPTVWMPVVEELRKISRARNGERISLAPFRIFCGGSAIPPALFTVFEEEFGVHLVHAWGMTETSPLGAVGVMRSIHDGLAGNDRLAQRSKQGHPAPLIEFRLVNDDGKTCPWDGRAVGELQVRGPYVVSHYFKNENSHAFTADGWFCTGDVGCIDSTGYMRLVDRSKDLIKSGGEWISSVELETLLMSHPAVLECAVVAMPHPRFQERPLAVMVLRKDASVPSKEELSKFLARSIAKWWIPDEFVVVDAIPKTSVGKFDKKVMRTQIDQLQRSKL